jgi:hypothetical protein
VQTGTLCRLVWCPTSQLLLALLAAAIDGPGTSVVDMVQNASSVWGNLLNLKTLRLSSNSGWLPQWSSLVNNLVHLHLSGGQWGEECVMLLLPDARCLCLRQLQPLTAVQPLMHCKRQGTKTHTNSIWRRLQGREAWLHPIDCFRWNCGRPAHTAWFTVPLLLVSHLHWLQAPSHGLSGHPTWRRCPLSTSQRRQARPSQLHGGMCRAPSLSRSSRRCNWRTSLPWWALCLPPG